MSLATKPTDRLDSEQQQTYFALADAALQHYALGSTTPIFIQHNAGIVFRVATPTQQYVLKLYKRVGEGHDPSVDQIEDGLEWLAAFAQASDVVVQVPVRTTQGQFVGQVTSSAVASPINCTVQQWIEGDLPHGDLTLHHAYHLGIMMAKLHTFSKTYSSTDRSSAMRHDTHALADNVRLLHMMIDTTLLPWQEFEIITAAQKRIAEQMVQLGNESDVWGPVHGDLHYDNLLFYKDEVRPIDFTGLRLAHYLYDIGVTLYHTFHQGIAIREAFFTGYQQLGTLPSVYQRYIEGFIAYAAIDNIAWNSTIPQQVESKLFQRNLQNLVKAYCEPIAQGTSFLFT